MTKEDLVKILQDNDLEIWEAAQAIVEVYSAYMDDRYAYSSIDDMVRNRDLMAFYFAAATYAGY